MTARQVIQFSKSLRSKSAIYSTLNLGFLIHKIYISIVVNVVKIQGDYCGAYTSCLTGLFILVT